jgi:hypothetical protein
MASMASSKDVEPVRTIAVTSSEGRIGDFSGAEGHIGPSGKPAKTALQDENLQCHVIQLQSLQ